MRRLKWLALTVISSLLAFMLLGCSPAPAATVNGTAIPEQEITDAIEAMRSQTPEWKDDVQWATILSSSGLTPETLREQVIDSKAREILVAEEAKAQGISADEATIDEQIAQTKASIGGDETTWTDALKRYGYPTEQDYRKTLTIGELTNKLYEAYAPEPTDEELQEYVEANLATYLTSQEYASPADAAVGDPVPDDPDALSEEYASPADAAVGDPVPDDPDALSEEYASPTSASSGYKIPEDGVVVYEDVPESIISEMKEQLILSTKSTKFTAWLEELVDNADIVVNPMPSGVSYNVDMSLAEGATDSSTDDSSNSSTTTGDSSSPEAVASAIAEGLEITDTVTGTGDEAVAGSKVSVLYTGTLEDGTVFDSTAKRDDTPFELVLGSGQVIKGWDAGLVGMQVGGKRTLVIPPSLGYGSQANGSIPANSTLIFEVELVAVNPAG